MVALSTRTENRKSQKVVNVVKAENYVNQVSRNVKQHDTFRHVNPTQTQVTKYTHIILTPFI